MDNVSADFTINENQPLQAEYTLGESEHFDCSFELFATGTAWGLITGNLEDQTDLWNVLSSKADTEIVEQNLGAIEGEISDLSDTVDNNYTTLVNRLENDELAISNNSGEITSLSNTIQSYGDIVTYNASSFATSAQGALANTALQPNDNISELNNDVGYITSASLPTVNDGKLALQVNSVDVGEFTANQSSTSTINIDVPTDTSDLTNGAKFLANNATGVNALAVGNTSQSTAEGGVAIGYGSKANSTYSTAIGQNASATNTNTTVIGRSAKATQARAIAIGSGAEANAQDAIAIKGINNTANTFQVYTYNMLDMSTGLIPDARISTNLARTADVATADNNLQSQIDAITASSDVTDIVGTYAQLQTYDTSTLPPNSIIKVLQDEHQNDETTYYRWVITGGVGAWVLIGEEGPYYTKSEANSTFVPQTRTINGKALSNNISLDASDVSALPSSTVIPTVNNGTLDIQVNGTSVGTFTANQSGNTTANIVVPDSATWGNITGDIADQTDLQDALDDKQDKLTAGTDLEIVQGSILPNSYTQLTSITSTGTQWINTGIKMTNNFKSVIVGRLTEIPTNSFRTILGANNNNLSQGKQNVLLGWGNSSNGFYAEPCTFPSYTYSSYPWDTNTHTFTTNVTPTVTTLDIDGVVDTINSAPSITGVNLAIFARLAQNDTVGSQVNFELNSIELYQSGSLVFKGVPAKRNSDDEVGLYDTVSGSFFSNSGTGDFVAGSEVPAITVINFTNDTGYITGIDSSDVTDALGYTPVNPSSLATVATTGSYNDLADKPYIPSGVVVDQTFDPTSTNAQSGVAINGAGFLTGITSSDVTTALGYTPYNSSNPNGYTSNVGTVTSVNNVQPVNGNVTITIPTVPTNVSAFTNDSGYITSSALTGYATQSWVGEQGYITGISSSDVTTALGYTPYNSSNPNGYTSNVGTVTSVNNVQPVNGNVTISIPDVSNFVTNSSLATTLQDYALNSDIPTATSDLTNDSGFITSADLPTVGNGTITITQGGVTKGTFTTNQSGNATIDLDAGGTGGIQNTATATDSLTIEGVANDTYQNSINIGTSSISDGDYSVSIGSTSGSGIVAGNFSVSIGSESANTYETTAGDYSVAIGVGATVESNSIAMGYEATSIGANNILIGKETYIDEWADNSIAIGNSASVSGETQYGDTNNNITNSIQLGEGTNETSNTLQVWNYPLLNKVTGLIPDARISSNIARTSQIPTVPTNVSAFTNDSGYITGITSSDVTTALGYTPYNSTNPNGYITSSALTGYATESWVGQQGYITGITSNDVTTALGYTPYNSTNPNGYITGVTSSDIITALGYTPANDTLSNLGATASPNFDGEWVVKNVTIAASVTWDSSTDDATYSIANQLPNDNYTYEVLVTGLATSAATAGRFMTIQIKSDVQTSNVYVCSARSLSSIQNQTAGAVLIRVGPARTITQYSSTATAANGTYSLYLKGYRRVGTNT